MPNKTTKEELGDVLAGLKKDLEGLGITADTVQSDIRNQPISEALDTSISPREELEPLDIIDPELLDEATEVARRQMKGELDPHTKANIERLSAEVSAQGGLGLSQAATNLMAGDIFRSQENLIRSGTELATKISDIRQRGDLAKADLNTRRAQFNESTRMKWAELELMNNQWRDTFGLQSGAMELKGQEFKLAAHTLISQSHSFTQGLINDLIIQNSRQEIDEFEQNMQQLAEDTMDLNEQIRKLVNP